MSVAIERQVEALASLPWSREILVDEDGGYVARIPELDGCFADGESPAEAVSHLEEVLRDWLAIALEEGRTIPEPRSRTQEYSGRFSVRVPRSLHRRLSEQAEAEAASLNQYVAVLLGQALSSDRRDAPQAISHAERVLDAHEDITADAVRYGPQAIGALKGIATFLRDHGAVNLSCLLYAVSADRVAQHDSREAASREYGAAAALARREGRHDLAVSLLYESLRHDRSNLRSLSTLGQLLHHQGRYKEAADLLADAPDFDNHARLFRGWSRLLSSLQEENEAGAAEGLSDVTGALRSWAYRNTDGRERDAWLRQLNRLVKLGPRFAAEVDQLLDFARANAGWQPITQTDLERVHPEDESDWAFSDARNLA